MSKSKFTESQAVSLVSATPGVEVKEKTKFIVFDREKYKGFKGLHTCAAYDYLKKCHGYR